jgi:5-(carboxyamino)imidazole ribonucleotide synthase
VTVLAPGQTVGILGGGQLGRMLAMAAAGLGLRAHVYAPEADSPAFEVAAAHTVGAYDDAEALARFADAVDVVTFEFENVPAATVAALESRRTVRPNRRTLELTQDRWTEKQFVGGLGIPTAPFAAVEDPGALARAVAQLGRPSILKTRRFGYDGKGQAVVRDGSDLAAVFRSLGVPAILEGMVAFDREVSVVAARGIDGAFRSYDLCENVHEHGILGTTTLPAAVAPSTEAVAVAIAQSIAEALDYVGVLAVEMFVVPDPAATGGERLVVNEIAPRVHNSGHWTLGGAVISQFEQHIRAVCGWPLGSTRRLGRILMRNIIGEAAHDWAALLAEEGASLHLYGKGEARAGRKMGHVTRVVAD